MMNRVRIPIRFLSGSAVNIPIQQRPAADNSLPKTHLSGLKGKPLRVNIPHGWSLRRNGAGLLLAVLFTGIAARAAETDWVYSTGSSSWFNTGNWSAGVPTASDDAFVANGTTAFVQGTTAAAAGNLSIDSGGVTIGDIDPGTLNVAGQISVGTSGSAGSLNLNYGTLSFNTLAVGSSGTYSDTTYGTLLLTGDAPTIKMASGTTVTVNSLVTGTNGLNKAGLGTLILLNDNTYSGGTTISAGTVQVGNGGTSGSLGFGDILNNGLLVFDRSDSITVSNAISGSGNLSQSGSGTLILTGDNSYSGFTTISNGTVQVGDGGTSGSLGSGNVLNNSRLVFDRSDVFTSSNAISGSGSVSQIGSGTTILIGDNSYSGSTTISNGTLQVGDGGTSGSLGSGNVLNNGALAFDRSDTITVSNVISGTGSLSQIGAGTLILTGDNSYSGFTTISNGTLQVGDGGTSGSLGTNEIHDFGALVFNRTNDVTVDNLITGTGSVSHSGAGLLTLTATNTYSGGTTVDGGGTLALSNSLALGSGDLTVAKGTLRADYSLTSGLEINVGGNYTQGSEGTLELWIGGAATTNYDHLLIGGAATLDGTLHLASYNDYVPYHNDELTLLTATNGMSGTFTTVSNEITHSALLDSDIVYGDNDVTLKWTQLSFVSFLAASNVTLTANQLAVAQNLDLIADSTDSNNVALINQLDYLDNLTNSLKSAFDMISPAALTALMQDSFAAMDSQGDNFMSRVSDLRSDYRKFYTDELRGMARATNDFDAYLDRPWDVYFSLPVYFADISGDDNAAGYSFNRVGLNAGADRRLNEHLYVGGGLGVSTGSGDLGNGGTLDTTGFNSQIYAVWLQGGVHLEAMLGAEASLYDTKRTSIGGTASGSTTGIGWTGLIGGGYDWERDAWKFGPQLAVQYMSAQVDGFTETGSLAPLNIDSQQADALHSQLGFNVRYRWRLEDSWTVITPEAYFGWRHDFMNDDLSVDSQLANGTGGTFTVNGPRLGSDSIVFSLGVGVQWKPAVNTYLNFTTQSGRSGYSVQSLNTGVRFNF